MINLLKYSTLTTAKTIFKNSLSTDVQIVRILNKENNLEIEIKDSNNSLKTLRYNPHWLRFNCQSIKSRQPSTGQRTIDIDTIPKNLLIENVQKVKDDIQIKWHESANQPVTIISLEYLLKNYPEETSPKTYYKPCHNLKFVDYLDLIDKKGNKKFEWLKILAEQGLCIVQNLPTQNEMVKNLASLIAPVQKTIYDEIFDVKVDKNPINIAYSNVPLEFHMDLMYYESSPGIQFLHCLRFDPEIIGGESLFVDSFEVAENFRKDHPKLFDILTNIPATFQKVHLERARPVCMLYQRPHIILNHRSRIIAVNWSPPFEGPLTGLSQDEIKAYYEAYLEFSKAINNHSNIIEYKLKPGDVACFNNRRVLHARKGFTQNNGTRHFQGCYVNIDEFKSEVLATELKLKSKTFTSDLELRSIAVGNHDFH